MLVPLDEAVYFDVITNDPVSGAVSDADSTPTFDVYEEATDAGLLGPQNLTKRTGLTGDYRGTFAASAANGFEVGKWYSVVASATVNGIPGKTVALGFFLLAAEASAGVLEARAQLVADSSLSSTTFATGAFDAIFTRALSAVEAGMGFRTLGGMISKLVNRVTTSGATLTVYQTDDATPLVTQTLTRDAAATPVVEVDTN